MYSYKLFLKAILIQMFYPSYTTLRMCSNWTPFADHKEEEMQSSPVKFIVKPETAHYKNHSTANICILTASEGQKGSHKDLKTFESSQNIFFTQ